MRQTISFVFAALAAATISAAPASACGYTSCTPCATPCAQTYAPAYSYTPTYSYAPAYTGCNTCNTGWAFEHLAEPTTQYYYVNQGPTYSGPGAFAPPPAYEEGTVSGGYATHPYYHGYHHRWHHYGYGPRFHHSPRYGYMPYYYGHPVLRRYY
jgi:hypothetical protein